MEVCCFLLLLKDKYGTFTKNNLKPQFFCECKSTETYNSQSETFTLDMRNKAVE